MLGWFRREADQTEPAGDHGIVAAGRTFAQVEKPGRVMKMRDTKLSIQGEYLLYKTLSYATCRVNRVE